MSWSIACGIVVLALLLGTLVWISERHRRRQMASRFAGREPLDIDKQVRDAYPDHEYLANTLRYYWGKTASILNIDGKLLRATDRFDKELAPVPGYPNEDEVDELSEFVRESFSCMDLSTDVAAIKTFGDCVLLLALGSQNIGDTSASGDITDRCG